MVPAEFRLQYSKEAIQNRVQQMAREIAVWNTANDSIVATPILNGALFFCADLVRAIPGSIEVMPLRAAAYRDDNELASAVRVDLGEVDVSGRRVLLIDDICDSGATLKNVKAALQDVGATEVKSAALVRRKVSRPLFEPDWVGFEFDSAEWFVGYGMDSHGGWRNLPDLYVISKG